MEREENVGFWDKKRMYLEKHRPNKSSHTLADAAYELKDVGPFAIDTSGAPLYKKTTALVAAILFYIIYWFWYGWVNEGFIDYLLLEQMTLGAFLGGMGVVIIIIAMLIDYHKGSFAPYTRILEMRVRTLTRGLLKRCEFKIRHAVELYNPVTGGYWRGPEVYKKEIEEEKEELGPEESKKGKKKATKKAEEKPKKVEEEPFVPIDLKDEDMPYYLLEGKRFHSIRDMKDIMDMALGKGEAVETKDEIKRALGLKQEFAKLAEMIRLPFHATLCEADTKGGRIYPLFISEHSLFGGSSGLGSFVEFREHALAQRTWVGLMSKENVRAGVGEGIDLGMYNFYGLVPEEFMLLGKKDEKIKFSPIIFVTASDAQAEKMMDNFRYNKTRKSPVQQDLIDASVIYDSSIADKLFEMNKLIVAQLRRKEKSEKELRSDTDYEIKDTVARGLEKSLIVERSGKGGILRNINLFSKTSVKYLFYIVCVLGAVFLAFYLLHYYGGINLNWLFPDTNGNETVTDDPWGNIIKPLWRLINK